MSDIDWVLCDREIRKRYAGQVVAVRDRHVWGAGETLDAALTAARAQDGCPDTAKLRFAVIPDEEDPLFYSPPRIPKSIPKASPGSPA